MWQSGHQAAGSTQAALTTAKAAVVFLRRLELVRHHQQAVEREPVLVAEELRPAGVRAAVAGVVEAGSGGGLDVVDLQSQAILS